MVGLFETRFPITVTTALPRGVSTEKAISILHDCETLTSMSPTWKNSQRKLPPAPEFDRQTSKIRAQEDCEFWEVEEDGSWIPAWLRSGTVTYDITFSSVSNGCDITAYANSLSTSTDQWRIVSGQVLSNGEVVLSENDDESGWLLQTVSDVVCTVNFASIIRSRAPVALKSVHEKIIDILRGDSS